MTVVILKQAENYNLEYKKTIHQHKEILYQTLQVFEIQDTIVIFIFLK